jgi:peptide chain release factor 2
MRLKEQQAKMEQLGGEKKNIGFGSQIRSYVLQPYRMVKDLRTRLTVGDVDRVLDGDLDAFIKEYLMQRALGKLAAVGAETDEE